VLRLVRRTTDTGGVRDERGFTLIELMTVILIIAILIVFALPSFLGARIRAFDAAVKSDIRNAFAAEKAYYTDSQTYTTDPATMTAIEAAITYVDGDTPLVTDVVYLHLHPIPNEIFVSARSRSGTCFYLREIDGGGAAFASDAACAVADTQTYTTSW
jgi:prepilin-type N-terminal cleavage/methylation domain-containing protein